MKKTVLLLASLFAVLCVLLSCSPKPGGGGNDTGGAGGEKPDEPTLPEKYLYTVGSDMNIVIEDGQVHLEEIIDLQSAFTKVMTKVPTITKKYDEGSKHNIFIGKIDTPLSEQANKRLERLDHNTDDTVGVVVLSDESSIAIAYDEDMFTSGTALFLAFDYLTENCLVEGTCAPEHGVLFEKTLELTKYQRQLDEERVARLWEAFETSLSQKVGSGKAEEIAESLKRAYMLFDPDVITWVANLYDPVTGGFYYSDSARDTVGYLPDLESTYQILSFLGGTGMSDGLPTSERIPAWMGEQIVRFVKSLQDPVSGYFYHPQWGGEDFAARREFIDNDYVSRRGRDLKWAVSLLKTFGARPTYDTPLGEKGDGILADGTPIPTLSPLTGRLTSDKVSPVSKLISVASESTVPAHLRDADSMWKYLSGLNIKNDSYYVGNLLESQTNQIVARDKVLDPSGRTTPLADAVKDYFDYHQNPNTGMWTEGEEVTYDGVNGLLKISGVYNGIKKALPNPVPALRSAMAGITIETPPTTVCFVLNPWYAITNIFDNAKRYNKEMTDSEVDAMIEALRSEILKSATELIDVTTAKTAKFVKEDGSFSYFPDTSGPNSQGVPVAVTGSREGDVNATYMFISGIPNHIFGILGYDFIPVFTTADRYRLWYELEDLGEIVKDEEIPPEAMDYEDEALGTLPVGVSANVGGGSTAGVERVDRTGKSNKAVVLNTHAGSADTLRFPLDYYSMFYNAVIFEADMMFKSNAGAGQIEMLPYGSQGDAYRMIFDFSKGGNVTVRTVNDFKSTFVAKEGEWFRIRLEYAYSDIDYDRNGTKDLYVSVYVGGEKIATGYTPATSAVLKAANVSGVRFFSWTATDASLAVDNVLFKQGTVTLPEAPKVNPEDNAEKVTFEESFNDNIPGKIGISDVTEGGVLEIVNSAAPPESDKTLMLTSSADYADVLKLYLTKYKDGRNAVALDTEIKITAIDSGGKLTLAFVNRFGATAALIDINYVKGGDITLSVPYGNGSHKATVAKEGEWFKLRVELFATTTETLMRAYVGGVAVLECDLPYNFHHSSALVDIAKLTVDKGSAASVTIDDVVLEELLFVKEDAIDLEEGYGFTDGIIPELVTGITSEGSSLEIVSDVRGGILTKSLRLSSPKGAADKLALTLSEEEHGNVFVFETDMKLADSDGDNSFIINHKTVDGRIANQLILGYSVSSGNVFAQNMYQSGTSTARDFSTVLVSEGYGSYFRLRLEYRMISESEISVKLFINGTQITSAHSVTPYSGGAIKAEDIVTVEIESYSAKSINLYLDNVVMKTETEDAPVIPDTPTTPDTPEPPTPDYPSYPDTPGDVFEEDDGSESYDDKGGNVDSGSWT